MLTQPMKSKNSEDNIYGCALIIYVIVNTRNSLWNKEYEG